jgi:hypothetical protein
MESYIYYLNSAIHKTNESAKVVKKYYKTGLTTVFFVAWQRFKPIALRGLFLVPNAVPYYKKKAMKTPLAF